MINSKRKNFIFEKIRKSKLVLYLEPFIFPHKQYSWCISKPSHNVTFDLKKIMLSREELSSNISILLKVLTFSNLPKHLDSTTKWSDLLFGLGPI